MAEKAKLVRVEMTATKKGDPGDRKTRTYKEGEVYDLPEELAVVFAENEWAKESKAKETTPEKEAKAKGSAPENKSR